MHPTLPAGCPHSAVFELSRRYTTVLALSAGRYAKDVAGVPAQSRVAVIGDTALSQW